MTQEAKNQARSKLEGWGDFIAKRGLIAGIIATAVIAIASYIALAQGEHSTLASVLTVAIGAFLTVVALIAVPFGLVVWGIVKICEED